MSQEHLFEELLSEELSSKESIDSSKSEESIDPSESQESQKSPDFLPPIDDPEISRVIAVGMRRL
ncbi:MAG: hypothetical protein HC895_24475 [Leptolyngbyaceae cyanobacterium SM1_3_5]|nr:hypothetical protein [Leptolyngbyaceae cyanobacterium SM1_3_5]